MIAIQRLLDIGLTRKQIALTVGLSEQAVGMYVRGERFPNERSYRGLVELAEARGIVLIARDFLSKKP